MRAALAFVVCLGCGQEILHAFPPPANGARGILYRVESLDGPKYFGAAPGEIVRFDAPVPVDALVAFAYAESLEALQLGPGELTPAADREIGRPLPPPLATLAHGEAGWSATSFEPYLGDRLEPFDYVHCVAVGGCTPRDGEPDRCVVPCPVPPTPESPMSPEPVCPVGWLHPPDDRCVPDEPASLDCAPGERQPIGASACEAVGSPCAADGWPAGITADLYVRPGQVGGDGSRATPLGRLEEALNLAPSGGVVALYAGAHPVIGPIAIDRDVQVVGACARGTSIEATGAGPIFRIDGARAEISELSLAGSLPVEVGATGEVVLDSMIIGAGPDAAVTSVGGGRVTLLRSSVRGRGAGAISISEGWLDLEESTLSANASFGIVAEASTISLHRARIVDTSLGAPVPPPDLAGFGVSIRRSTISGRQLVLDRNDRGAVVIGVGSVADITDLIARENGTTNVESFPVLAQVSEVRLTRAQIARNFGSGLYIDASTFALEDLLIEDGLEAVTGLTLYNASSGSVNRMRFQDAGHYAINGDSFPVVEMRDVTISGGSPLPDDLSPAVVLFRGTEILVERLSIADATTLGLLARSGPGMQMRDLTIRRTQGGMVVDRLGGAAFERILVEDCLESGVLVALPQCPDPPCHLINIEDLTIRGMKAGRIQPTGLLLSLSSIVDVQRFEIADGEGTGATFDAPGVTVGDGDIHGNAIGLVTTGRVSRSLAGVRVRDNRTDLEISQ